MLFLKPENFFMKKLLYRALSFFNIVESKIAFYPTVLAIFGIFFAFLLLYFENLGVSKYLLEKAPALVVDNGNTAMTILSALISGLISVIVFSFSMVMLLLSQASSNYSPRLLPGLISDKKHQIILGIYLSTILYNIFILFSIQPTGDKYQIPGFAVLMGIIGTVICIYAFIFFIHNISQSIQISNILKKIYSQSKIRMTEVIEKESTHLAPFPDSEDWYEYHSEKSGYLQNMSYTNMIDFCIENDTQLHIIPFKGSFILNGIPLFRSRNELNKDQVTQILSNISFAREELVEDNYILGFKQLTEVIVKAMSPGINDPGTAINAIDYLTELFALRMQKKDINVIRRDEAAFLKITTVNFKELIYQVMVAIRTYCKHDVTLNQKLLIMLHYLLQQETYNEDYYNIIKAEATLLLTDAKEAVTNTADVDRLISLAESLTFQVNNTTTNA
ncbi:putative membrane protein [Gillisia mitskevichiae]|uniref:Putative membrane protein n=2 Tax=Gillisia mitskevichiae TaxID=270921 RepID=A0A495PVA8_9FLAO|nr:putative membrane protein [Gillisia mitskevichiae]